jgi:hypothetical protein
MRESRTYGSVRGVLSNERPYRDRGDLLRCVRSRMTPEQTLASHTPFYDIAGADTMQVPKPRRT